MDFPRRQRPAPSLKHRLASAAVRQPLTVLDQINWNARFNAWARAAVDIPRFEQREDLYRFVHRPLAGAPIDYLEFGVFRGESLLVWTKLSADPASRFVGFDTFSGLPEPWMVIPSGTFDVGGEAPRFDDRRVAFIKGLFQETLRPFLADYRPGAALVIHIDSDLYSSCQYVLAVCDAIVRPGTRIIFDEFNCFLDEFRAWTDYLAAFRRDARLIGATTHHAQVAFEITG
jgi:O-methyltransferase